MYKISIVLCMYSKYTVLLVYKISIATQIILIHGHNAPPKPHITTSGTDYSVTYLVVYLKNKIIIFRVIYTIYYLVFT